MRSTTATGDVDSATTSECAPQPNPTATTEPSAGEYSLPHTPNSARSEPATGRKNPQVPHRPGAARAMSVPGPCGPSYQRLAASVRPVRDITRTRPSPTSIASSSTPRAPEARVPRHLLERRAVGGEVGRDQPVVALRGGQQVADAEVPRAHPLVP